MARKVITDDEVEEEIAALQNSDYVKLARLERQLKNKRRMYLYHLRQEEKRGKELAAAGITSDRLREMYALEAMDVDI